MTWTWKVSIVETEFGVIGRTCGFASCRFHSVSGDCRIWFLLTWGWNMIIRMEHEFGVIYRACDFAACRFPVSAGQLRRPSGLSCPVASSEAWRPRPL